LLDQIYFVIEWGKEQGILNNLANIYSVHSAQVLKR